VQWEFAGRLGPPPGRYVVRRYAGDDVRQVIVVGEPTAAEPRRRRRRRTPAGPAAAVAPVTRVTVIDAHPLEDPAAWLRDAHAGIAAAALGRLVGLHRIAAADPWVADPDPARALVTRVGYGPGEVVAEGAWEAARELTPDEAPRRPRLRRGPDLQPHERLAALLSARDAALACEELALRARGDLDRERHCEAAIQLEAALTTALAELEGWRGTAGIARRLAELESYRDGVAQAAAAAREGRLEAAHVETVSAALARLEAALKARSLGAGS
jgi:hypothetical protein